MKAVNDWLLDRWDEYHALIMVAAGVAGLLILLSLLIYVKVGKRPVRPALMWVGSNLALLLNGHGMWVIATETLELPDEFAVLVFAVFEVAIMNAMSIAADRYRKTCEYDADGKLIRPGHPGKMLYVVWLIAITSGVVVATNAPTLTERILRLALPVIVVLMWWATLTADGQQARRTRFAFSPMRLMTRWGWWIGDEDEDLDRLRSDRRVRLLVVYGHRLHAHVVGAWWHEWRLTRIARESTEAEVVAATAQLEQTIRIVHRLVPGVRADQKVADEGVVSGSGADPVSPQAEHQVSQSDVYRYGDVTQRSDLYRYGDASCEAFDDAPVSHLAYPSEAPADAPGEASVMRPAYPSEAPAAAPRRASKRRSGKQMTRQERLDAALRYVADEDVPARQAALKYALPVSTVQRHVKAARVNGNVPQLSDQS